MTEGVSEDTLDELDDEEPGPARALTIHVLRMLETRVDAAGIALQSELQQFSTRLQMRLLTAGAFFLALWAGIVLLAIALPPHLRIPVLSGVTVAFVLVGIWAHLRANHVVASRDVGSMAWFLENLRLDVEAVSKSLAKSRAERRSPPETPTPETTPQYTSDTAPENHRSDSNDLAA